MKGSATLEEAAARFWAKVVKTESCWLWAASKNAAGYGNFRSNTFFRGELLAHRVAFRLRHGRAPKGELRHTCDNPACVNPEHLLEGTHADNMRDMAVRGRAASRKGAAHIPRGERHHFYAKGYKLTREVARHIRTSGERNKDLALLYGVDPSLVSRIKTGKYWRD